MNIDLSITDITPQNKRAKMLKAVRALSDRLGVPVSVEDRKKQSHGGEPFFYRAQEELAYKWYNFFSAAVNGAYSLIISHFGLPEIRTLSKAEDILKYKGKILYSPETGQPIKLSQWNDFVKLLDKFLNRKLSGAEKIILNGKTLGRILGRMLKYNKLDEVTGINLKDIKYHGKTFDWISDSVKNMRTALGGQFSRSEMARIQVMQQSAAQRVTKVSDSMKADVKQILIDGVKNHKSKSQISQDLFDKMTGHNRDFQKIADTEIQNAMNNSYLLDEVHGAEEGEKVYFQRKEVIDHATCPFCKKMNGVIVLWSDHPLPDDRIKDPIASHSIWDGKDWDGKKDFIANGILHPFCRGLWLRYHSKAVDALVAQTQNKAEQYNEAVDKAREEYKEKGIPNPHDKTPGFIDKIQDIYYGPEPGKESQRKYGEAFNQARDEFEARGIANPTGKTPGFRERIQEIYSGLMNKSNPYHDVLGKFTFGPDTGGLGGGGISTKPKNSIEALNNEDKRRLINAYELYKMSGQNFEQISENQGYSETVKNKIKKLFNKMTTSNITVGNARHITNGEYASNTETLKFYIEHIGARDRQTGSREFAQEIGYYDLEDLQNKLRGLSTKHPELINYTTTHDLDKLTISKSMDTVSGRVYKALGIEKAFNPNQPRDERGRWTGGAGGAVKLPSKEGKKIRASWKEAYEYGSRHKDVHINTLYSDTAYGNNDDIPQALKHNNPSDAVLKMMEYGNKGLKMPEYVYAERIGKVRRDGEGDIDSRSYNYRDQVWENGLSTLGIYDDDGNLQKQGDGTFALFNEGKHYIVGGWLLNETGSDGEPLLMGVDYEEPLDDKLSERVRKALYGDDYLPKRPQKRQIAKSYSDRVIEVTYGGNV